MVERHSTAQSEVVPGDAQVLVIHGDGSPPAHKRSTVGEDWGLGADEGEEADDDNIGFLGEQPGITNTKLYENEVTLIVAVASTLPNAILCRHSMNIQSFCNI